MTPVELGTFLQDFYRETLELVLARQANARSVGAYDANNAYQQVLGRQDVHLRWIADVAGGGAVVPVVRVNGRWPPLWTSGVLRCTTHHAAPVPAMPKTSTAAAIRRRVRRRIRGTLATRRWRQIRPRRCNYAVRSCGATTVRPVKSP